MKLKINKACDLNSISVLPPQSRRPSAIPTGLQASQLRSQTSQQSFSQGISSQRGMFSQLSQTSFDEALTNDQRVSSQERENSVKKTSCLPLVSYAREESQMPISRSTSNLMRKWNPISVPDHKCQVLEELEHRIGMMETSLNKFGMILGSVQSDVMQVNKGTKEVSLEMEGIRQKLIVLETSLQLMIKGQEDTKFTLDGNLKSISDQLSKDMYQDKSQQIFSVLSALSKQMEASLLKLHNDLRMTFTKVTACNLKTLNQSSPSIAVLPRKVTGCYTAPQRKQESPGNPAMPRRACGQVTVCPKIEMGAWNTVRPEQATFTQRASHKEEKRKGVSSFQKEKQCSVIVESDEEIDGGFSCLIDEKETGIGNYMIDEAAEESERILRRARRQKRKYCNPIIIN
ncbi:putative recombination initiation defects 3 isoform X1 [Hevea brasiliensis]|uniref:putative recombination initiation defects 3 isoform X1 n=1 Tax=Hevea brasiliensis TaxID=3981 RepID=UPI0025F4B10F|nr:putative recombination initiation defects 3 isoform X1 [Hevea brasiliensis]XP_057997862.1 putative recombination initiation defects 3 isoform X1 [Hevea brasiliensis]